MTNSLIDLAEARRTTAWYRRWFSEPGDSDRTLVERCSAHLRRGAWTLLLSPVVWTFPLYRSQGPRGAIIALGVCLFFGGIFWFLAARLDRVRRLILSEGLENLSDGTAKT